MFFVKEHYDKTTKEVNDRKGAVVVRQLGLKWKALTESQKEIYFKMSRDDSERYKQEKMELDKLLSQ